MGKGVKVESLKNLGEKSASWLHDIGIHTKTDLKKAGVIPTFLALKKVGHQVNLNMLWAMVGALMDIHWTDVPPELKEKLKEELKKD